MIKKIEKYLLGLLIVLFPTQLALHFWPVWSYVYGIRIDFLSPSLYLTDLIIFTLIFIRVDIFKKYFKFILVIIMFALFNTIFSSFVFLSIYRWIKIGEFVFLAIYIKEQKIIEIDQIIKLLFYSSVVISVIGIIQFLIGRNLGGVLYFLGERNISLNTPGIALIEISGREFLRSYSTFSHPNSLAGYLGALLIITLCSGVIKKNIKNIIFVLLINICFILTFSISSYFGVLTVLLFWGISKFKKTYKSLVIIFLLLVVAFSLTLPILSSHLINNYMFSKNIYERLELNIASGNIISAKIITGSGLGTFIPTSAGLKMENNYLWLLTPVHNIFLLVLSENGLFIFIGFVFLLLKLFFKSLKTNSNYLVLALIFIMFTGLSDHYWITLQQNILLFAVIAGSSFVKKSLTNPNKR